jgi:hypothetical protein
MDMKYGNLHKFSFRSNAMYFLTQYRRNMNMNRCWIF